MTVIAESLFIDTIIDNALDLCRELPETPEYLLHSRNIRDLRDRLAGGRLHIAVLGQFNRGKSTFINALLGMEILPVSVLPITSVPTVISYGEINQCVISFSDNKEDAIIEGDPDVIVAHLDNYVTERNNPKNHLCVSEAIVKCKSSLLEHGTVIIDTPGFGSTHTHNTQTTLNLLASCDAALFLLSADLPITQVEVDFLKSVIQTVPRVFFIYNKTDLLNSKELEVSDKFIKDILIKNFGFSLGIRLFPVSAIMMKQKQKNNKTFIKSGLAAIEKEILDFLLREKYFTLSEALTAKFRDALAQILTSLESTRNEIIKPINEIKEKLDQIIQLGKTVQAEMNKALSLSKVEETALYEYCDKLMVMKKEGLHKLMLDRLNGLLNSVSGSKQDPIINAALTQLLEEMFNRLFIYFVTEHNKPLRNAAAAHVRELNNLTEGVETELDIQIDKENTFQSKIELVEIDVSTVWKPESSLVLDPPRSSFLERFSGSDKRYKRLFEHYSPQLLSIIDKGLEELSEHVINLISSVFESFVNEFKNDYTMIVQIVKERQTEVENTHKDAQEKAEPELLKLDSLIKGFAEVKDMVI